jgi:hypothetical protein
MQFCMDMVPYVNYANSEFERLQSVLPTLRLLEFVRWKVNVAAINNNLRMR